MTCNDQRSLLLIVGESGGTVSFAGGPGQIPGWGREGETPVSSEDPAV